MAATAVAPTATVSTRKLSAKQRGELIKQREQELAEARSQMNPALLKVVTEMDKKLETFARNSFRFIWDLGEQLNVIQDQEKKYGPDPFAQIAKALDYTNRSSLYKARQFRSCFSSDELDLLMNSRSALSGNRLSWRHVEVLMQCKSARQRARLIKDTCDQDLTVEELFKMVRKGDVKGDDKHAGGRKVKVPPTISGRIENLQKYAEIIVRNENLIWHHPENGFKVTVEKLDPSKVTPELVAQLETALGTLDGVETAVGSIRSELQKSIEVANKRLTAQAGRKPVAAATDDEDVEDDEEPEDVPEEPTDDDLAAEEAETTEE